jgi:catechol 2,3-dioxygenase-like lactoylglutathione lyase family enzyme
MTPRALAHVGLTVPDIDRAIAWYRDVLGFDVLVGPVTVTADGTHGGRCAAEVFGSRFGAMRQAHLVAGNGVGLELFEFAEPPTGTPAGFRYWDVGLFHLCVRDPDVDGLADRIAATGGRRRTATHASFPGEPYRWCYCEDPFGNVVEVYSHSHEQVYANRR